MTKILAIESSCDETAAAVIVEGKIRANIISTQLKHTQYGGVVPEIASRLHQQKIVAVVKAALEQAEVRQESLSAIAFTRGPGLMGALLVGCSFAKAYALGLGVPLIDVHHMEAHVAANYLNPNPPNFPFLCLTVSGGHTQLMIVKDYLSMEIIGETLDDAAGEAFDKAAQLLGLGYPGGPKIDLHAQQGNVKRFSFPTPKVPGLNFSFSGLKTALLYFLRNELEKNKAFIDENLADICASYQQKIIDILLDKAKEAAEQYHINEIALAGGVSANKSLRAQLESMCNEKGWASHIPAFEYCTDNAAMIAEVAHHKYRQKLFCELDVKPFARG